MGKIIYKTDEEIELIKLSSVLVGKTLAEVAKLIKPGVTTLQLDKVAEEFIRDNNAIPGFWECMIFQIHFVLLLMKL